MRFSDSFLSKHHKLFLVFNLNKTRHVNGKYCLQLLKILPENTISPERDGIGRSLVQPLSSQRDLSFDLGEPESTYGLILWSFQQDFEENHKEFASDARDPL